MNRVNRKLNTLWLLIIFSCFVIGGCQKEKDGDGGIPIAGNAFGDLEGRFPSPTVAKLRGRGLSVVKPTNGQALVWNETDSLWTPTTLRGVGLWTTTGNHVSNNNSGFVGIGTATPTTRLHVNGGVRITDGTLIVENNRIASTAGGAFNLLPTAVAHVQPSGVKTSGTNNITCVWNTDHYELDLAQDLTGAVPVITPLAGTNQGPRIGTYIIGAPGKIFVYLWSGNNKVQGGFGCVVYKP